MRNLIYSISLIIVVSFIFTGCGLRHPYHNQGTKNLIIESDISGTLSEKVHGYLNISSMDKDCHRNFLGTVELSDGTETISLPENKMMLLEVKYVRQPRIVWNGGTYVVATNRDESILTVKKGYVYKLTTSYDDRFYNTELFMQNSKSKKFKELPMLNRKACRQIKKH